MDSYLVYCFLGFAETEDQKIFHWNQWEKCFFLFDELFAPFAKNSFIESDQSYVIPLRPRKGDPTWMKRVTFKGFRMGNLKWNYEDNKKWSHRLFQQEEHPIRLKSTYILSSKPKTRGVSEPQEIQLSIFNYERYSIDAPAGTDQKYDQSLNIIIGKKVMESRPFQYWDDLVSKLSPVVKAVRIGRTTRPWALSRTSYNTFSHANVLETSCLGHNQLGKKCDSLELESSWQTWAYLM